MTTAVPAFRPRVLSDVIAPTHRLATDAALVVVGTALVAGLAQVSVPLWPVPITGQTLAVIIVGAGLGAWRGAASLALYLVLGAVGLPVFSEFSSGLAIPSLGYVIGFIPAAFVIGRLAEHDWDRHVLRALAAFAGASVIPFLVGVPYLGFALARLGLPHDVPTLIAAGVTPFIVGGVVKALIAALVVPFAWRGVAALSRRR